MNINRNARPARATARQPARVNNKEDKKSTTPCPPDSHTTTTNVLLIGCKKNSSCLCKAATINEFSIYIYIWSLFEWTNKAWTLIHFVIFFVFF